ncbi:MAG: class I SAM-dependent methyltransferase [Thermoleophilaceae bacterium]
MRIAAASYDTLGRRYAAIRRPDPRLAAAIWSALGDARSVVNVGGGTGSYEPPDREVIAVEPSEVMIAQRPAGAAPAVRAAAESLPLGDGAVDAALAVLTMQHWDEVDRGLRELLRVARRRVVLVTMDVDVLAELWLIRDYVPEMIAAHAASFPSIGWLLETLPGASVSSLPIARDCTDGFMAAYWGRPEAYLDPAVRAGTSPWQQLPAQLVHRALDRLEADLRHGEWDRRYGRLRRRETLDVGLRLIRCES